MLQVALLSSAQFFYKTVWKEVIIGGSIVKLNLQHYTLIYQLKELLTPTLFVELGEHVENVLPHVQFIVELLQLLLAFTTRIAQIRQS